MQQTSDQLRSWFKNVEPICAELFNAAYVMCGNYDLAEYAVRSAILDVWLQNVGSGMGFRERLRNSLRREAMDAALGPGAEEAEFTWPGIPAPGDADRILTLAAQERLETQRLLMLRFGCGLSPRTINQLTGVAQGKQRTDLDHFESRCRRILSGQDRARTEALIIRSFRRLLAKASPGNPQSGQIYRAFEAEADGTQMAEHRVSRIIGGVLTALLALIFAGAFWLFAVLVQPV